MEYNNLYKEFCDFFKEDKEKIGGIAQAMNVDSSDGMHIQFGMVVVPFVVELIENNEKTKCKLAFDYFEKMALSNDKLVSEVLEFTILEDFISRGNDFLDICKQYMGKETLACCEAVEKYL